MFAVVDAMYGAEASAATEAVIGMPFVSVCQVSKFLNDNVSISWFLEVSPEERKEIVPDENNIHILEKETELSLWSYLTLTPNLTSDASFNSKASIFSCYGADRSNPGAAGVLIGSVAAVFKERKATAISGRSRNTTVYGDAYRGAFISLSCNATGRPAPHMTWRLNGTTVREDRNHVMERKGRRLRARVTGSGREVWFVQYECIASNPFNTVSRAIRLTILENESNHGFIVAGAFGLIFCTLVAASYLVSRTQEKVGSARRKSLHLSSFPTHVVNGNYESYDPNYSLRDKDVPETETTIQT